MRSGGNRFRLLAATGVVLAATLAACSSSATPSTTTGSATLDSATTSTFGPAKVFSPAGAAVNGSTDVYHCFLVDPHLTTDRQLVSSEFIPEARKEVHHAIYFLIPPQHVAEARALNAQTGGNGWSCFGAPLNPNGTFDNTTWLGGWAPGPIVAHPTPPGTGISMPAGSLVVMQIHYNLLAGTAPDQSRVRITTVPAAGSHLQELQATKYVAPPDLPCPPGVTGPLCDRQASIADLVARTGTQALVLLDAIESACRADHDPAHPQIDGNLVTTTCTWSVDRTEHILGATPHMHLLGQSESIVLIHGSTDTTLASVAHYNFDGQRSYPAPPGTYAVAGDKVRVTCTYDPTLRQELPSLRKLPARYVTWGDGSSDEMCLGTVGWVAH
jgi:Copper type II ascorbate-dependent monooxygenase, C-terminal domain